MPFFIFLNFNLDRKTWKATQVILTGSADSRKKSHANSLSGTLIHCSEFLRLCQNWFNSFDLFRREFRFLFRLLDFSSPLLHYQDDELCTMLLGKLNVFYLSVIRKFCLQTCCSQIWHKRMGMSSYTLIRWNSRLFKRLVFTNKVINEIHLSKFSDWNNLVLLLSHNLYVTYRSFFVRAYKLITAY